MNVYRLIHLIIKTGKLFLRGGIPKNPPGYTQFSSQCSYLYAPQPVCILAKVVYKCKNTNKSFWMGRNMCWHPNKLKAVMGNAAICMGNAEACLE